MSLKSVLERLLRKSVRLVVGYGEEALQDRHNVDVFLSACLNGSGELLKTRDYAESIPFLVEIPKRSRSWSYATRVFSVVSARRISSWSAVRSSGRSPSDGNEGLQTLLSLTPLYLGMTLD
jgi:hypothetical protein